MGTMRAMGFAEAAEDGLLDVRGAVDLHLTTNFYPPLRANFLPTAMAAIDAFDEEDGHRKIDLPDGVMHAHTNSNTMPAWQVVDNLHLEPFIGLGSEVEL